MVCCHCYVEDKRMKTITIKGENSQEFDNAMNEFDKTHDVKFTQPQIFGTGDGLQTKVFFYCLVTYTEKPKASEKDFCTDNQIPPYTEPQPVPECTKTKETVEEVFVDDDDDELGGL